VISDVVVDSEERIDIAVLRVVESDIAVVVINDCEVVSIALVVDDKISVVIGSVVV
jgi:hypothetical protein